MISIGYSEFIRLCRVKDVHDWMPCLEVRHDGVWVVPPEDDLCLSPNERAIVSQHPDKDLTKPSLRFPCSLKELQGFLEDAGCYGCIDVFDMAAFILEETRSPRLPESTIAYREFPDAIQVACDVYEEFWHYKPGNMNPTPTKKIEAYVRARLNRTTSNQEVEHIVTLARPYKEKRGGAPAQDRETYKGKSQEMKKTPR
jgi:hypothetical protein